MYKILFVILIVTQPSIANDVSSNLKNLTYKEAEVYLEKPYLNSKHRSYTSQTITYNQQHKITEQGDCYMHDGDVYLITITNSEGIIERAIPKIVNKKSKCYASLLEGKVFPKPPYAPFFDQWMFI